MHLYQTQFPRTHLVDGLLEPRRAKRGRRPAPGATHTPGWPSHTPPPDPAPARDAGGRADRAFGRAATVLDGARSAGALAALHGGVRQRRWRCRRPVAIALPRVRLAAAAGRRGLGTGRRRHAARWPQTGKRCLPSAHTPRHVASPPTQARAAALGGRPRDRGPRSRHHLPRAAASRSAGGRAAAGAVGAAPAAGAGASHAGHDAGGAAATTAGGAARSARAARAARVL
jgi:hypothetical protein